MAKIKAFGRMQLNLRVKSNSCVLLFLALVGLGGCDRDPYSGFGAVCTEGHPAVALARSLTPAQRSLVYSEIYRLRAENGQNSVEYGAFGTDVPENLQFLKAARIRPSDENIMLAGCMDEYIYLRFSGPDTENPGIVLSWAAGTVQSPYNTESEVLWRAGK